MYACVVAYVYACLPENPFCTRGAHLAMFSHRQVPSPTTATAVSSLTFSGVPVYCHVIKQTDAALMMIVLVILLLLTLIDTVITYRMVLLLMTECLNELVCSRATR